MISLGGYRFKSNVNPYHARNKTKSYDYAKRPRWRGVEALQFKGRKAVSLTFDIKVVIEKQSDLDILPELDSLGDAGEALKLISTSEGGYMGLWVITNITQKDDTFTRAGTALVQVAQLTIEEFVE